MEIEIPKRRSKSEPEASWHWYVELAVKVLAVVLATAIVAYIEGRRPPAVPMALYGDEAGAGRELVLALGGPGSETGLVSIDGNAYVITWDVFDGRIGEGALSCASVGGYSGRIQIERDSVVNVQIASIHFAGGTSVAPTVIRKPSGGDRRVRSEPSERVAAKAVPGSPRPRAGTGHARANDGRRRAGESGSARIARFVGVFRQVVA